MAKKQSSKQKTRPDLIKLVKSVKSNQSNPFRNTGTCWSTMSIDVFTASFESGWNCWPIDNSFCTLLPVVVKIRKIWMFMHGILRIVHYCCLSGIVLHSVCEQKNWTLLLTISWCTLQLSTVYISRQYLLSSCLSSRYIKLDHLESKCSTKNLTQPKCNSNFRFLALF